MKNLFLDALGIKSTENLALHRFARAAGIPVERLKYYNKRNKNPTGNDLKLIIDATGISEAELMIQMGEMDNQITSLIQKNVKKEMVLMNFQLN